MNFSDRHSPIPLAYPPTPRCFHESAYDATTDMAIGTLDSANGQPLINGHLWALETRAPGSGFDPNAVYISAAIDDEADGPFAKITANTPEPATIFGTALGLAALALFENRSLAPNPSGVLKEPTERSLL